MSLSDRKEQVQKLQEKLEKGEEIDVAAEFDKLVDYLREHGYEIVKREFPETNQSRTEEYTRKLEEEENVRTPTEIEESLKDLCRQMDSDPEEVWGAQVFEVVRRCKKTGRTRDFAELIEYIRAGHSLIKQTNNEQQS